MSCPNAFVKKEWEINEFEPMPARPYLDVVDPCARCRGSVHKSTSSKPWEQCMRQRRQCLRRNEDHPLPPIRRVPIDELDEDRDFACVFQADGSDTITWDKETRCRVPCDKCWNLAQCLRMKHTLDPHDIAFLDIDDAPGVTPAKRSCKNSSPSGSATKTPGSGERAPKRARTSPSKGLVVEPRAAGGSCPPAPPVAPTPFPLLPPRPPVAPVSVTGPTVPLVSSTRSYYSAVGCFDRRGNPILRGNPVPDVGKGKGPARKQSAGGGGGGDGGASGGSDEAGGKCTPRMPSPDAGAGAGAGVGARRNQLYASNKRNDIYMDKLRELVQLAASKVKETSDHLVDLDNVKKYARAQIRDAERLLSSSEIKEQQAQAKLARFKVEEAEAKGLLKQALVGSAQKLQAEAARLEKEARLLP
ncbi:unnamed protein product [Ectocarpus sp. CCAP 1310/34]|nr:unnamed protein product [Ectocarpus sp. CCAP 1310/34]